MGVSLSHGNAELEKLSRQIRGELAKKKEDGCAASSENIGGELSTEVTVIAVPQTLLRPATGTIYKNVIWHTLAHGKLRKMAFATRKMAFATASFGVFLLLLDMGQSSTVIMTDSHEFFAQSYQCFKSTNWQKYCEYWDFTKGSCRPWRLSACEAPYVHPQLSPCPKFVCEVTKLN